MSRSRVFEESVWQRLDEFQYRPYKAWQYGDAHRPPSKGDLCLRLNKDYKEFLDEDTYPSVFRTKHERWLSHELGKCKILLLTANPVETYSLHMYVHRYCRGNKKSRLPRRIASDGVVYHFFKWKTYDVVHVYQEDIGSHTEGGSNPVLMKVLQNFTPNLILSVGVAFGAFSCEIPPKQDKKLYTKEEKEYQEIGDVLISKRICIYDSGVKRKDGEHIIKSEQTFAIDSWLKARIQMHPHRFMTKRISKHTFDFDEDFKECGGEHVIPFRIYYGDVLSGGFVVDDAEFMLSLLDAYDDGRHDIIGGEMEGAGVFGLCKDKGISCAVIKGICDWGTQKNDFAIACYNKNLEERKPDIKIESADDIKDGYQVFAAHNAFLVLESLLEDTDIFLGYRQANTYRNGISFLLALLLCSVLALFGVLTLPKFPFLGIPMLGSSPAISFIAFHVMSKVHLTGKFLRWFKK